MTHQCREHMTRQPPQSKVAVLIGLLIVGSQVPVTQAQLSPCTPIQQDRGDTSCESPRESSKSLFHSLKGWFGFGSEEPKRENLRGLEPLPKPSFKSDPYELNPIVKPNQPPIDGVRDYLNRQDPAHAIYPIDPVTPRRSSPP